MSHGICDLTSGITLIVSDLCGDQEAFTRYVARFRQLHSRGRADRLLFLGDLIGSTPRGMPITDNDRAVLRAYGRLQAELGADQVIALIGDRELALLQSEQRVETDSFNLLSTMPILVRSASGVTFTHTGASRSALFALSQLTAGIEARLMESSIVDTVCEQSESPALYGRLTEQFLRALSVQAAQPLPQRFIVSGHLPINGGYKVVTPRHLRIASAACAHPREAGIYLLLDLGEPIHSLEGLAEHSGSIFTVPVTA